jgi:hypothetical protein
MSVKVVLKSRIFDEEEWDYSPSIEAGRAAFEIKASAKKFAANDGIERTVEFFTDTFSEKWSTSDS